MIKICPAILTDLSSDFERQIKEYSTLFDWIDIDLNVKIDNFKGKVTLSMEQLLPLLEKYPNNRFNIHLMTEFPLVEIKKTLNSSMFKKLKFIIHQESKVDDEIFTILGREDIAVTLEVDTNLESWEYYNLYSEVQLMTVAVGYQGGEFRKDVLEKAKLLKNNGFTGLISIDGGVNLESAKIIKQYPINRVSVGSYFSKSHDIESYLMLLNDALGNVTC